MIVFSLHYFPLLEYELMPFTENRLESMGRWTLVSTDFFEKPTLWAKWCWICVHMKVSRSYELAALPLIHMIFDYVCKVVDFPLVFEPNTDIVCTIFHY